jgi:L-lactate permease
MAMQGAIQNGLYTLKSPVEFTCTTANCTWPTFYTVGICSSCTNVTAKVNATCIDTGESTMGGATRGGRCNFTLPSGLTLHGEYGSTIVGKIGPLLNGTAEAGNSGFAGGQIRVAQQTGLSLLVSRAAAKTGGGTHIPKHLNVVSRGA